MSLTATTDEANRRLERRQLESELFSLEADRTHLTRRRDEHVVLLQGLRQKLRQLEQQVEEAEGALHTLEAKILEQETGVNTAKKKLRLL